MKPNPGYQPAETRGKRIRVRLANGYVAKDNGIQPGWGADTCRWRLEDFAFDIAEYEVLA